MPPSRPITHTKFELIFVEVCPERPAVDTVQDFFVQAAHETTYAFSGKKHFFIAYIRSSLDLPKLSTTSSMIVKF